MPLALAEGGLTRRVGAGDLRVPEVVEVVRLTQRPSADPAEVRAVFEDITPRMNQSGTLLYREVAQGEDGQWLLINFWSSRAAMEALNAKAQDWTEAFQAFAALVDPASVSLQSYRLR